MTFGDARVQAVHEAYERRYAAEQERLSSMGAAGFSIRDELLLPVGVEVGTFLHALILARRPARILELGTSYGYSTLFLADAAREVGARVITMEKADFKQDEAKRQIEVAGLGHWVEFRLGDAVQMIETDPGPFDLILLDIWKELYVPCFEAFYPKLTDEGLIVADNMITPEAARPDVREYRAAVNGKPDLQTVLLPIGQGIELTARWSAQNSKL